MDHPSDPTLLAPPLGRLTLLETQDDRGYYSYGFNVFPGRKSVGTVQSEVDWRVMPLTQWGGNDEVKAKRQAEFLVHDSFLWSAIERIGVMSAAVAAKVQARLGGGAPPVVVEPDWYY